MSFKGFSIFSSGGHFVQRRGAILAFLVESHPRNISVNFSEIEPLAQKEMSLEESVHRQTDGGKDDGQISTTIARLEHEAQGNLKKQQSKEMVILRRKAAWA